MKDIVFVILSFLVFDETCNCIKSIRDNIDTNNYHIVVIDNCSPNHVGVQLQEKYKDQNDITICVTEDNLGFANGNNRGIEIAQKMGTKFICCLNNDTILEQQNFFRTISAEYQDGMPAVIGPQVMLTDGSIYHMNRSLLSIQQYQSIVDGRHYLFRRVIEYVERSFRKRNKKLMLKKEKRMDDVLLHGCCLVFTPTFFEKLSGFDSRTFLYGEEELLYVSLKKNGLTSRYAPELKILHLEDASTNVAITDKKARNEKKLKHSNESLQILIQELKENYGKID